MNLETIAKKLLFKILDIIIPILLDQLKDQEAVLTEWVEAKAEKLAGKLTIEELTAEANDFGKILKKLRDKWF